MGYFTLFGVTAPSGLSPLQPATIMGNTLTTSSVPPFSFPRSLTLQSALVLTPVVTTTQVVFKTPAPIMTTASNLVTNGLFASASLVQRLVPSPTPLKQSLKAHIDFNLDNNSFCLQWNKCSKSSPLPLLPIL